MFELGTIDDLVCPEPGSTTGRALASMSLRRTFEALKAIEPEGRDGAAREAALALRASFARRLPGDPHAIAHAVAEPAIGIPIRRGLVDERFLPEAIERLLVRLGDVDGSIEGTETTIFGKVVLRRQDRFLERCVGAASTEEVDVLAFREALDRLRREAPGTYADFERFGRVFFVGDADTIEETSIGLGLVPPGADANRIFESVVASIIRGKIFALVESRRHDPSCRDSLIRIAADVAIARLGNRVASSWVHPTVAPEDPLRSVVDELARLAPPAKE